MAEWKKQSDGGGGEFWQASLPNGWEMEVGRFGGEWCGELWDDTSLPRGTIEAPTPEDAREAIGQLARLRIQAVRDDANEALEALDKIGEVNDG